MAVIDNWRSSHSYPLQATKMTLLRRARKVDSEAIIAQRLKRISSIRNKLRLQPKMLLSRMHDIGGCRAVVSSADRVDQLVEMYRKSKAKNPDRSEWIKPEDYDYIRQPKLSGYRSFHVVLQYRTESEKHRIYNGQRVEIQLRSQLQHAWATAVETVDTFTGQALKSSLGDKSWERFFALMGSAIAIREDRPLVPGTPTGLALGAELKSLADELNVINVMTGLGTAIPRITADAPEDAYAFLLVLDPEAKSISITPYGQQNLFEANEEYARIEKETQGGQAQAVLVSVDSIATLQSAYPNYYLDTSAFVEVVKHAIA
jgi:hypothetical protein